VSAFRLILSILKAAPLLGRLFSKVDDFFKERKAQSRYEEKLDFIDDAVAKYSKPRVLNNKTKQRKKTNKPSTVSKGRRSRTRVDKGGTKDSSGSRVSNRKKITKKKTKNAKEKRFTTSKGGRKRIQQTKKNA
jgi:hypothetical protein